MDDAVRMLRTQPGRAAFVRDAYLSADVAEAAERFRTSPEFAAVLQLIGGTAEGATVIDVGAGNGIASHAFVKAGASRVVAVDPNPSDEVGLGAAARLPTAHCIERILARGEDLPVENEIADIVYARQVLHHADSLARFTQELARVLKTGGRLVATREHVAESPADLERFLAEHPTHHLVGGEHAYPLDAYVQAIERAGLRLLHVLGPWETIINAFPAARTEVELREHPTLALRRRLGMAGIALSRVPGATRLVGRYVERPRPGDLHTFVAVKPDARTSDRMTRQ